MEDGVNYTAGLPVVRTSPAHGTAYDIAGKGLASDPFSFASWNTFSISIFSHRSWQRIPVFNFMATPPFINGSDPFRPGT